MEYNYVRDFTYYIRFSALQYIINLFIRWLGKLFTYLNKY